MSLLFTRMAKVILKFHINILDRPSILHYIKCARQTTLAKRINNELDFVCVHWPLRPIYSLSLIYTNIFVEQGRHYEFLTGKNAAP